MKKDFITWDDKYLVNVPDLDEAHFNLFGLVNKLYEISQSEVPDQKKLMRTFHNFLEYVYTHFSEEEDFMEKNSYPGVTEHKKLHDNIRKQFEGHFLAFKDNTIDMDQFLKFTRDWLTQHIMSEDQKYISN